MMKKKHLVLGLVLALFVSLGSCGDDLSKVGTSIQDEDDKITVYVDSFYYESSTVLMESIYAKSDTGLLGEFYDPLYGTLKSDYLCQFYCPEDFRFEHTPIDGKIDSVDFQIFYNSLIGDSLAPMRAQVYPVIRPLDKDYYTDADPAEYADLRNSLGSQTYTAKDLTVSDSIRNSTGYYPVVRIRMPKDLGQKFYDETIQNPSSFNNQESFNEFFPGLYVTNTFGTGSIIGVDLSYFMIHYRYIGKGSADQDTIIHTQEIFNVTKEVIQLNRFKNTEMGDLLEPNEEFSYIKAPAGVTTKIIIPAKQIAPLIDGRLLNNLPFVLYSMPQPTHQYALDQPKKLLLLPQDSIKTFFENNKVDDNVTAFLATYNADINGYSFGNISNVLKTHIEKSPEKDLTLMVFPVNVKTETSSYYGTSYTTNVAHYFFPAGLMLRKDEDIRKLKLISSKYGSTAKK